jgi:hypothetical protein
MGKEFLAVKLGKEMKKNLDEQAKARGYISTSEFVRQMIRKELMRVSWFTRDWGWLKCKMQTQKKIKLGIGSPCLKV